MKITKYPALLFRPDLFIKNTTFVFTVMNQTGNQNPFFEITWKTPTKALASKQIVRTDLQWGSLVTLICIWSKKFSIFWCVKDYVEIRKFVTYCTIWNLIIPKILLFIFSRIITSFTYQRHFLNKFPFLCRNPFKIFSHWKPLIWGIKNIKKHVKKHKSIKVTPNWT